MKIEVLISTMNQSNSSLIDKVKVVTDALVINQVVEPVEIEYENKNSDIRYISFVEKGLSLSRNRAIDNAKGDICLLTDDDVVLTDDYEDIIINAYKKYPKADLILFHVKRHYPKKYPKKNKISYLSSLKFSSVEITFKLESIKEKNIQFNSIFGSGSQKYISGEENIFLIDCLKSNLRIYHVDQVIASVGDSKSTWYKGFNDDYFISKGAFSREVFGCFSWIGITYFLLRKHKKYKRKYSFIDSYILMMKGSVEYKRILKGKGI